MCGINGIFAYHYAANSVDPDEVMRTRDHMAARGPDGRGIWVGQGRQVALAHRRLSIIDLSEAGAQPMASADGQLVVTFNGEIYNYKSLRKQLEAKGRVFRSSSDTEVLLHLYAEKGPEMVRDLRGMFAFSIWDAERQRLFLARDPLGIKPLYYCDDGWTFRFASQVKALLAGGAISRDVDPAGWVGFYLLGSVPEPYTCYSAIRSVPAGSTITVDRIGAGAPKQYHSIASIFAASPQSCEPAQRSASVRAALLESVECHIVADVPVGAFLSAGVDSGALVGLMRDAGSNDIKTVTVAFEEFRSTSADEAIEARACANYYQTDHSERVVTKSEFYADLPRILDAMDQPSIDGVNTWFVAKAANELGLKVAISGVGGDELFGGYPSFHDIPRWVRRMRPLRLLPGFGRLAREVMTYLASPLGLSPKAAGMAELGNSYPGAWFLRRGLYMPWELQQIMGAEMAAEGLRRLKLMDHIASLLQPQPATPFGRVAVLEASLYMRNQLLRDTDWASMAHSLEVRVPLVDHVLLSQLAGLNSSLAEGEGKRLLGAAPRKALPKEIMTRRKTGFTTPVEAWMRSSELVQNSPSSSNDLPRAGMPWARKWSQVVGSALSPTQASGNAGKSQIIGP